MNIDFTSKQFRRLLDLAYIGNWVLNSARGNDRIPDFDEVESYLFSQCPRFGMNTLFEEVDGEILPSKAFSQYCHRNCRQQAVSHPHFYAHMQRHFHPRLTVI